MKESFRNLPENKQDELERIVSVIRGQCKGVEMIILFGSYAKGNYREEADLKPDGNLPLPQYANEIKNIIVLIITNRYKEKKN